MTVDMMTAEFEAGMADLDRLEDAIRVVMARMDAIVV